MTAQINDRFNYKGKSYRISAIQYPEKFFNIKKLKIKHQWINTACRRGYVAEFSIYENNLALTTLMTNVHRKTKPIAINGIMPRIDIDNDKDYEFREWDYQNINLKLNYSGSIIITDGFIRERYVHMGFQSPFSYEVVIELSFKDGVLIKSNDMSQIAKQMRETQTSKIDKSGFKCLGWIADCFDLDYKTKWVDKDKK
jgi:hypothetical protein